MPLLIEEIPKFSLDEAESLARELYGIDASATELPSERDQNFLLNDSRGIRFVLKIANSSSQRGLLEAQNAAMAHIGRATSTLRCPEVLATLAGDELTKVSGTGSGEYYVRTLTYLPGVLLGELQPHREGLLRSLGSFFGQLDRILEGFSHPGTVRDFKWDLRHAAEAVRTYLPHVAGFAARSLVETYLSRFEETVVPVLPDLRTGVIHNDGNGYNVLAEETEPHNHVVTGVIDFGDMVKTCMVIELAVAAAYALLGKPDAISAATHVIGGYHNANPLTDLEQSVLFDLIMMRLCVSVTISAYQSKQNPANEYLVISQRPAWNALNQLATVDPAEARRAIHATCGNNK